MSEYSLYFCCITAMDTTKFIAFFIFAFVSGVLSFEEEAETEGDVFAPNLKTFTPFSSWLGIPFRVWQNWFSNFWPFYSPSHTHRPKPPCWWGTCASKPQTDNIFGIYGPPGKDVEYLPPPDQIDWGFINNDFTLDSL